MFIFKALSKQLFGTRYEGIVKSLLVCAVLYCSLFATGIRVTIAQSVLFLTATVFTAGVMWQVLSSSSNAENLTGLFMLPFYRKSFIFSYIGILSCYIIVTKTAVLLSILFAVGKWNFLQIVVVFVCVCHACAVTAVLYSSQQRSHIYVALWIIVILIVIFCVKNTEGILCITCISFLLAMFFLYRADAYQFYGCIRVNVAVNYYRKKESIYIYLFRYLMGRKNYLVNTVGLWGMACFLPALLGQFESGDMILLGYAILSMNTPICMLLSCDLDLEQAVRVLPGQSMQFCRQYGLFIFLINMIGNSIYLCSWGFQINSISALNILEAAMFALQSALLSVLLEWFFPIRKWKIESDLWHHPRKFMVPLLMMLLAICISAWMTVICFWFVVLLIESFILLFKFRRV